MTTRPSAGRRRAASRARPYGAWWALCALAGLALSACGEPAPAPGLPPLTDRAVDADPPVDGGPPDSAPAPDAAIGPCATLPTLTHEDGRFVFEGETLADDHHCACGGQGGDDRALRFQAPVAGRWRFHVEAATFDPLLALRADCLLAESQWTCNDDLRYPRRRDAAAQVDLAAGETVIVIVDAFAARDWPRGGQFRVVAEPVPVRALADACDPLGLADGCATGAWCAPDDPRRIGGGGHCAVDGPPELDAASATRVGDVLALRVAGRDVSADVREVRVRLWADGAPLALDDHGADTWVLPTAVAGQTRFETTHRAALLAGLPQTDEIELWLVDARGHASRRARLTPSPSPPRALGAPCDPDAVDDHCPAGALCRGDAPTCEALTAPTVTGARAWWNPEAPAFALQVFGADPDGDVVGVEIEVFDDHGALSGEVTRPFDAVWSAPEGGYGAELGFPANPDVALAAVAVQVFDAQGLASPVTPAALGGPTAADPGAACDPFGARITCPAGTRCIDAPARCAEPAVACPADGATAPLEPQAPAVFAVEIDLLTALGDPALGPASCGGGLAPVAVPFTAPMAGRWTAELVGADPDADPVLSARTHCGHGAAWSERACNDDRAPGELSPRVSLDLAPGETVYWIVDGYTGPDGDWAGPVTLTVRLAR